MVQGKKQLNSKPKFATLFSHIVVPLFVARMIRCSSSCSLLAMRTYLGRVMRLLSYWRSWSVISMSFISRLTGR